MGTCNSFKSVVTSVVTLITQMVNVDSAAKESSAEGKAVRRKQRKEEG